MKNFAIMNLLATTSVKAVYPVACGERSILSQNGQYCFECPQHTRAQDQHTRCGPDTCERSQILTIKGNCEECPKG